jgi:predicted alpha/beta-fold hydrolase
MPTQLASFQARGLLKNPHIQSILSSSIWRKRFGLKRLSTLTASRQERLLTLPDGTRLSGVHYESLKPNTENVLVLLLHGWEGSVQSSYINHSAAELLSEGYAVFALNFRDHGLTHGLNEGLFHSCRLQEVIDAVKQVVQIYQPQHFFVAGFSLGGNFALRMALATPTEDLPIETVFAICPPVDPSAVMRELETGPALYHWYFMKKWRDSLRRKRELFPQTHDFDDAILKRDMRGLTQWLVEQHTHWEHEEAYFSGYSVAGNQLSDLSIPAHILAAEDDPVIPIVTLQTLQLSGFAKLEISEHGGHCGFIENWHLQGYAERWLKNGVANALQLTQSY